MKNITSTTNPAIKIVASLHTKEARQKLGLCIAEGERTVETFLQSPLVLEELYITEEHVPLLLRYTSSGSTQDERGYRPQIGVNDRITLVSEQVMKKISTATTPSGIVGVFRIPQNPKKTLERGVVLANIQDPGNMGTLIRTAVALATPTIVIVEGTDPWSPKVIQASAGTIAHAAIYQLTWDELVQRKQEAQLTLVALVVADGEPLEGVATSTSLLVVGNEARGLPESWLAQCDARATIPMPGNTESLNAAVAGSIALYITAGRLDILNKN